MKYLVISKHAERREEMKSVLRQLDRRSQIQEVHDWLQAETPLKHERKDLVFADLANALDHREAFAMRQRHPAVVLAVLSDELDAQTTVNLLRSGLRAVIPRQLDWRSMIRALELVLLGGHYVPAHALHLSAAKPPPAGAALEAAEQMLPYRRRLIDSTALSPRQQQIMRLVHMGSTNKSIARALGISEGTVKIHLATVFRMLGATNRAAAVAIYNGWLFEQVQRRHADPPFGSMLRPAGGKAHHPMPATLFGAAALVTPLLDDVAPEEDGAPDDVTREDGGVDTDDDADVGEPDDGAGNDRQGGGR